MKMVKALLLGATAGLVSVAGAQAADLPGKAAPASYVKICDTYGAGYFFIPGSNTCLKIGGDVRLHLLTGTTTAAGDNSIQNATRFRLNADARSQTEYGLLRAFGEVLFRRGSSASGYMNLGATTQPDQSLTVLNAAFIQFGPLTAGYAPSFFNFYGGGGFADGLGAGPFNPSTTNTTLLAFTASFGGGILATLSVEDRNAREVGAQFALSNTGAGAAATSPFAHPLAQVATTGRVFYAGQMLPDLVAALRVEQGWGAVQLMGALHHINAWNVNGTETAAALPATGATLQALGWAVGAGVRLKLDQFAKGDNFNIQGVVTNGAINYVFNGTNSADGLAVNSSGVGLSTVAFADAAYAPADPSGTGLAKTTAWAVFAGFQHFFTPAVRSTLYGNYVNVDATGGVGLNDFQTWNVGLATLYSPVRDLDLGLDIGYRSLDRQNALGVATATFPNSNGWYSIVRVQRNF